MDLKLGTLVDSQKACRLDRDQLVTHGVIFGMTGSGKTGLSITLLEELILADVPLILIDPKGDLPNLALLFPELEPEAFLPWVNEQDGATRQEVAEATAARWRKGLESSQIDSTRLAELKQKMALTIYTPGSESGQPVNVLGAFTCPSQKKKVETAPVATT